MDLWNLTAGKVHATDYTNACRTMLFNIHSLCWDRELLELFQIPACLLPEVRRSWGRFGSMRADLIPGLQADICGMCGDQQAALFGHGCLKPGSIKNTYGTGCFLLLNTGDKPAASKQGLLTTLTAQTSYGKPVYALEGSVFAGGATVQWLRDGLKILDKAADSEALAKSVPDADGVVFVPAFTGLGAPYWDMYARGTISGLTRGTRREHIVRAALEAIAFQSLDVIEAMRLDSGQTVSAIRVDGGASANNFLMQFQADISCCRVIRPELQETTAWGAAALAGLGAEIWRAPQDIFTVLCAERTFTSKMLPKDRARAATRWQKAVARTCSR
ncbi:MAG: FGGY-family carbohydrate kinase [Elusimicrobiaceae bacterium]|nr:FGGY-family carbohydrate kinase [Elusimicrobiaceae bacterium]